MPKENEDSNVDDLFKDLDEEAEKLNKEKENVLDDDKSNLNDDSEKDEPSVKDLLTQIEDMKRERQGLMSAAKSERHKRQDIQQNLDSLTSTVNGLLQQRQAAKKVDDITENILPVEFTEDGDEAFIKSEKVESLLQPLQEKIQQLEAALVNTTGAAEGNRKAQESIEAIVGEDERYSKVYNKFKSARQWINSQVIDFQKDNNIKGILNSGQVLDHIVDKNMEDEFKKKYPELDIIDVITAGDSQRHFRGMLSKTAAVLDELNGNVNNPVNKKDSSNFKKIINKPSGLGSATNAKGGELSISEKVGNLDALDIMDLSDKQVKQLEKALLAEEVAGGVDFK